MSIERRNNRFSNAIGGFTPSIDTVFDVRAIWPSLNGVAEELNSKIMSIKRKAGGFRNPSNLTTAIYFHRGGLAYTHANSGWFQKSLTCPRKFFHGA
jgi:hypothetical protein